MLVEEMVTIGGEANGRALRPVRMCVVQAGVAALVLDSDRLDGELAVGHGGTEPHSSLVGRLDHGVAPLGEGGHLTGFSLPRCVPPHHLLHLFGQAVGAQQGRLLAAHCCLIAVGRNLRWEP